MCENSNFSWNPMYSLNLSSNSDKDFKLAQILQLGLVDLIFDLRQTLKGRKTKAGITILVPEFNWFKNALLAKDDKTHVLEHGNRIISINKSIPDTLISMTKADGTVRKIILEVEEKEKLLQHIENIEDKLITSALEREIPTFVHDLIYFKEYIV